jgi:hypothetical protein
LHEGTKPCAFVSLFGDSCPLSNKEICFMLVHSFISHVLGKYLPWSSVYVECFFVASMRPLTS